MGISKVKVFILLTILFLINFLAFSNSLELLIFIFLTILMLVGVNYAFQLNNNLLLFVIIIVPSLGYLNETYRLPISNYGSGFIAGYWGLLIIINYFLRFNFKIVENITIRFLFVFTIISLLTTIIIIENNNYLVAFFSWLRIFSWFTVASIVYQSIKNKKDIEEIFMAISFSIIIPILFYSLNYYLGRYEFIPYFYGQTAIINPFGSSNQLAIFSFMSLSVFSYFYFKREINFINFIIILFIFILLLGISYSRTSFISASILFIGFSIILRKRIFILIGTFFVWILFNIFGNNLILRLTSGADLNDSKNSLIGRIELWIMALNFLSKDIFWGKGIGIEKTSLFRNMTNDQPVHNGLISILLEVGIIGGVPFFIYLFMTIIPNIKSTINKNDDKFIIYSIILIAQIIFIITFFTENTYYSIYNMWLYIIISSIGLKLRHIQ